MAIIRPGSFANAQATVPTPTVKTSKTWGNPATWTAQNELYLQSLTKRVMPGESQATLNTTYGFGKTPYLAVTSPASAPVRLYAFDDTILRDLIRIEVPASAAVTVDGAPDPGGSPATPLVFYGTVEAINEQHEGVMVIDGDPDPILVDSGVQSLVCYGLEHLLDKEPIRGSYFKDPTGGADPVFCARAIDFNADGKGNRSADKHNDSYLFGGEEFWSTRDIVEYLVDRLLPMKFDGAGEPADSDIPWEVANLTLAPDWDKPVVRQDGRTLKQLLQQVLNRERLIGWFVDVDETVPTAPVPKVSIFTYTSAPIALPVGTIAANPNVHTYSIDAGDSAANAAFVNSTLPQVDQVLVRGARRRSVFGARCVEDPADPNDGTWQIERGGAWNDAAMTEYNQGDSLALDYPDVTEPRRRRAFDAPARGRQELSDVFSFFELRQDWNGEGDSDGFGFNHPVDPIDGNPFVGNVPYSGDVRILPTLPLLAGNKYQDAAGGGVEVTTIEGTKAGEEVPPLVFFERWRYVLDNIDAVLNGDEADYVAEGIPGKYVESRSLGGAASLPQVKPDLTGFDSARWGATPRVEGRGLRLFFTGLPKHIIGLNQFVPLDHDLVKPDTDWRKMICTIAIELDRYCEVLEPDPHGGGGDAIDPRRMLLVDAGDRFRYDYVTPGTPVRVAPNGDLVRLSGGVIRDDRDQLKPIAQTVLKWRDRVRRAATFHGGRVFGTLKLGDYIDYYGEALPLYVESVVTEITYSSPGAYSEGQTAQESNPSFTIQTAYGELDPLSLITVK